MLVESVASIDRRLLGASKSRKDTCTNLKRIKSKVAADFSKIYTRLQFALTEEIGIEGPGNDVQVSD